MELNANLAYWSGALANLCVIVTCASIGVRCIRRGEVRSHKRMMLTASTLVGFFLVSYVVKVMLLGKEDVGEWEPLDRKVLYAHELFVASMLVAGAYAGRRAWRFRKTLGSGPLPPASAATRRDRSQHRIAGWVAIGGSVLGLATAVLVLAGMFKRAAG